MDLGSSASGLHRPEQSILPMMPPSLPRALATESLTQSTTTEAGASYSTPSLAPASVRSLRGESDGPPVTQCSESTVFAWSNEFSWNDSGLCFGGDPLKISRTPEDHSSKVDLGSESAFSQSHEPATKVLAHRVPDDDFIRYGLAGMGAYAEHSSPTELPDDLESAFTICSIPSATPSISEATDSDLATDPFQKDPEITMHECVDWVIKLLVDVFFRSYAPQSSKGRATGKSQKGIQNASDNRAGEISGLSKEGKARANPRKRKALGDDEGSEDEGFQGRKRKPIGIELAEDSLRWACPFVKLDPKRYKCLVAPKEIRKLKAHIKNMHYGKQCERCFTVNPTAIHGKEYCTPSSQSPPLGFITGGMKDELSQRVSRRDTHEKQWYRIWDVLFPGVKHCETPYLDKETVNSLRTAKEFSASPECEEVIQRHLTKWKFQGKFRKQVQDMIHKVLLLELVHLMQLFLSRDGNSAELVQGVPKETEPPRCDLIEGSGSEETTPALDSVPQPFQLSHSEIAALEPAQFSMPDFQPLSGELPVNGNASGCPPSMAGLEEPLGTFEPEYSGFYLSDTRSTSSDVSFGSDLKLSGLNTNEAPLGMMPEMVDYNWPDLSESMSFPDEL